nr:hypothetical protein [Tanacetum cinerariifolium]
MGRDTIQLETTVSTISQEYLLEFTSEYGISEDLHPELHGPEERIVDFPEDIDLFNLISAPNHSKVKTCLRPRAAHEVPLLMTTASRVIDMEDLDMAIESSGTSFATEKSPLDFDNENPSPPMIKGKGTKDQAHETVAPEIPPRNMPAIGVALENRSHTGVKHDPIPTGNVATMEVQDTHSAKSAGSGKLTSSSSIVGSPGDHIVPPGYFSGLRHMPNAEILSQYNKNLAQHVAMGSIHVREEQIKKLNQEVQGLQNQTSNLKTLLEAETDMKKVVEAKNADLTKELESLRTQFLDLQEFKKYEVDKVEKGCAEMDARLNAMSIDFDKELYPHMLTAIAGRRWVIGHDLRLAVMSLAHGIERGKASRGLEIVKAYDLEANNKYLQALQEPKDLKYPILDQLKGLKDAPMEVIMASLHLESNSEEDVPKWIRVLRPITSQLKIHVYMEVRDP